MPILTVSASARAMLGTPNSPAAPSAAPPASNFRRDTGCPDTFRAFVFMISSQVLSRATVRGFTDGARGGRRRPRAGQAGISRLRTGVPSSSAAATSFASETNPKCVAMS